MTTVIVADDQAMVRAGFAALLDAQADLDVVGQASNGFEAIAQTRDLAPDVVLMDVRMPHLDGLGAARQILDAEQPPRVLMLTTFDIDDYVYEALRAGASGFLLKDAPPAELISAVRVVARGDALLAPSVTRRLIEQCVRNHQPTGRLDGLTARESEVLTLIAQGLSNAEIALELVVAEETVKTHVGRIFGKLNVRDRAQAVVLAYESGLVRPRA